MDVLDMAQDRIEIDLAQAMQAQKERANGTVRALPDGSCKNPRCCEEFVPRLDENGERIKGDELRLFCGPGCAQDFERLVKQ